MHKENLMSDLSYFLSEHIREIENIKESLLNGYYSNNTIESMNVENFFKDYINTVNAYLNSSKVCSGNSNCPFVIIKSTVEVQDMDDMDTYLYHIVPPYHEGANHDADYASCLSPLGRALLFKSINQKVQVETPAGVLRYIIRKITVPELSA